MVDESFNYESDSRYLNISIKRSADALKVLMSKQATPDIINEMRLTINELNDDLKEFKLCTKRGFASMDKSLKAEEVKKYEDVLISNQESVKRLVNPTIAKANSFIAEFEGEKIRESLNNTSVNMSHTPMGESNIKLPKIDVPKFDGNIEKFLEFSALYQNMVHEEASIPKVRKLYYLKDALVGEPHNLIRDIPLSDKGYDEAWSLILSTYKDMKRITRKHFDNLFAINRIKSHEDIPNLLSQVSQSLKGLKACGEDPDSWSSILCYLISEKIDEQTYIDFEKSLTTNTKFPAWKALRTFLENRASVTKRQSDSAKSTKKYESNPKRTTLTTTKPDSKINSPSSTNTYSKPKCVCCLKFHLLIDCEDFKSKTPRQRYELLKTKSVCLNCFRSNHKTGECTKSPLCKKCSSPHHTLLHFDNPNEQKESQKPSASENGSGTSSSSNTNQSSASCLSTNESSLLSVRNSIVLLPSAVVNYQCGNKIGSMRVLLDSCSQLNLVSFDFIKSNNLATYKNKFVQKISGIGDNNQCCDKLVNLRIESKSESFAFYSEFNVINTRIPYSVISAKSDQFSVANFREYKLADPAYYNDTINISKINAIFGIELYNKCVKSDVVQFGNICLRDTHLGWVISSTSHSNSDNLKHSNSFTIASEYVDSFCFLTVDRIDERLRRFWETEEVESPKSDQSEFDLCNQHFEKTYTRNANGQFVVRLPFIRDPSVITGNFDSALSHYNRIANRLTSENPISDLYKNFMREYLELNHMTRVIDPNVSERYFIPHHAVMKPSSTTTKLRVVFNASSKTKSGFSLNDILMTGPVIQPDLFENLLRLRTYKYAFTADITKMYRCVIVHEDDRKYQSILWDGKVHELNTITYGTGPASFQATKCLEKLADEYEKSEPVASEFIRRNFYMDDFGGGASTEYDAIRLQKTIHCILLTAGFQLRKYQSNSMNLLNKIEPDLIEKNLTVTFGNNESLSILGLSWTPTLDTFQLKTDLESTSTTITKRLMLSMISKIFDPLGLAAPVVIRGKLLLQQVWKLGLAWDTPVTDEVAADFRSYLNELIELNQFSCVRYVGMSKTSRLVGFADASEQAYCAAVYVLTDNKSELYCSKTRVAPVKALTIPQLELQAAVLLATLIERVNRVVNLPREQIVLFTDSTIVLSWLSRPASDWKLFVRNRVSKISNVFPISHWHHVRSAQNPADLATRRLSTTSLIKSTLWLHGPEFLSSNIYPKTETEIDERCFNYLSKPKAVVCIASQHAHDINIIQSYSSYSRLIRAYATAKSIAHRFRIKSTNPISITLHEMIFAESHLIRIVQQTDFSDDYQRLSNNQKLCKHSRLRTLMPFIDDDGLIRSRSRLQNAQIPFNRKCPIIVPARSHFITLYITYLHYRYFHANRPFLTAYLSTKYLFVGGMSRPIKSVIRKCIDCRRYFHQSQPQQMANLPADRVNPRSPFEAVGIDFTGAFNVKCNHHRVTKYAKVYAAIFICMITRAVHIELVPSLSTEDFLNSLKCLVSRRGLPAVIYSDNGTNFKGAERHLNLQDKSVSKFATENRIEWRFNPPYTPHRGGIWESAVKSAKRFIPIITKDQTFTENELRVLLTQIEGLLNSRPLAYRKTSEPTEEVLTPGHFLIGRNLTIVPEPSSSGTVKLSAQYRANRQRIRDFWKLWSVDYLNQLRSRSKWLDIKPNLEVGQIVIYKESNTPPAKWPLARVTRCFPDSNGVVRTIEMSTSDWSKVVPVNHAIYLPIDQQ